MPIGVPKVTYIKKSSGRRNEWIDVYTRLAQDRVLFMTGELKPESRKQTLRLILFIAAENINTPISLYVNGWGGSISDGLRIWDTAQNMPNELKTINFGIAASIPAFVVAGGSNGKRFALPHARFLLSPRRITNQGAAIDIFTELEEMARTRRLIVDLYSLFTGQSKDRLLAALDRDDFINADESKRYGLIDAVSNDK